LSPPTQNTFKTKFQKKTSTKVSFFQIKINFAFQQPIFSKRCLMFNPANGCPEFHNRKYTNSLFLSWRGLRGIFGGSNKSGMDNWG
jgi:hypothetical protein